MRDEAESLKQESQPQQLPDLESVRDHFLSGLKVGKQAPEYKRTKSTLDKFIAQVLSQ